MRRIFQFQWRSPAHIREDVDAEVRFHLEARVEELDRQGHVPRRGDRRGAPGVRRPRRRPPVHAADRSAQRNGRRRRRNYMWDFQRDVLYAIRRLRSSPGFTTAAILTLALGIGANSAIFSIVNSVLFRPLPFPDPERLYAVYSANRTADALQAPVSAVDLDDWRAQRQQIEDLGGYFYAEGSTGIDMTGRGDPRRLSVVFFTPGFFSALRVTPSQGRLPLENEMIRGGRDRVVLLSHRVLDERIRRLDDRRRDVGHARRLAARGARRVAGRHAVPDRSGRRVRAVLDDSRLGYSADPAGPRAVGRGARQAGHRPGGRPDRDEHDREPACGTISGRSRVGRDDGPAAS